MTKKVEKILKKLWHGMKREDIARHEKTQQGTRRHGKAREDTERHGKARKGTERHGKALEGTGTRARNVSFSWIIELTNSAAETNKLHKVFPRA